MPFPRAISIGSISGASVTGDCHTPSFFGQTINDVTPLMGGTADRGCLVLVSIGGAVFSTTADDAGHWSLDTRNEVPLSGHFDLRRDGRKTLVVIAIDSGGRSRAIQGEFIVLTASPEPPTLATVRVFRSRPLLDGHAEPGTEVTIALGGAIYMTTAANSGAWTIDTALQEPVDGRLELGLDGRKQVDMVCTDLAGNSSISSDFLELDSSANMSRLAVAPVSRELEGGAIFPLFADVGRAWRAAIEAKRCECPHPSSR